MIPRHASGAATFARESATPKLSHDRTIELFRRMRSGDPSAREAIASSNYPLVLALARRFPFHDPDDLFQSGIVGLLKAIDCFDPDSGNRFSTYASKAVYRHIFDSLIPEKSGGLSMNRNTYIKLNKQGHQFHKRIEIDMDRNLSHERTIDPIQVLIRKEEEDILLQEIDRLSPRDAAMIEARHGLRGVESQTMVSLGIRHNITKQYVVKLMAHLERRLMLRLTRRGLASMVVAVAVALACFATSAEAGGRRAGCRQIRRTPPVAQGFRSVPPSAPAPAIPSIASVPTDALGAINAARANQGLPPFLPDGSLYATASANSSRGFGHHGFHRGYEAVATAWSADQAVALWLSSPPHRAILFGSGRYAGFAIVGGIATLDVR